MLRAEFPRVMGIPINRICRMMPPLLVGQVEGQKQHGQHRAHGDAADGAGGAQFQTKAGVYQIPGQRQADPQLAQRLQHLGDSGGRHIPLPLGVAPHTGQQAHAEHRRGQGPDSLRRHGIFLEGCQLGGAEGHQRGSQHPQQEKHPDRGPENPPLLILPPLGVGLTGELGDGNGQARRGEGQQEVVDLVGGVEVRLAYAAQDVVEGQLVDGADQLDDQCRRRQDSGAAQKGLLFLIRHEAFTSDYRENSGGGRTALRKPMAGGCCL